MLIHKGSLQLTNFGQTTSEFIFELFTESFEFYFLALGFLQVLQSITQLRVQVGLRFAICWITVSWITPRRIAV